MVGLKRSSLCECLEELNCLFSSSCQFQTHILEGPLRMKRGISKTAHREGEACIMRRGSLAASLNIFMDIIQAPMLETIDKGRKRECSLLKSSFKGRSCTICRLQRCVAAAKLASCQQCLQRQGSWFPGILHSSSSSVALPRVSFVLFARLFLLI